MFYNKENNAISEAISGEYLKIAISFEVNQKFNFGDLIIAVNFKDSYDNVVISYVTDEMGIKFNKPTKNILEIEIPQLLIRGGQYTVRLLAMEGDTQRENFLDEIDNAFSINVLSADFWNSGKTLRNGNSAYMDGKMNILYERTYPSNSIISTFFEEYTELLKKL